MLNEYLFRSSIFDFNHQANIPEFYFSNKLNLTNFKYIKRKININSSKENGQIINEISDLIKCYICLNKIKNPKMCKFCQHLACDECIRKWLNEKNICGYCRHKITRFDFIDVPFMTYIKILLD